MAPELTMIMERRETDDDACPDYNAAVSRSNTSGSVSVRWQPFDDPPAPLNISRRNQRLERYIYTYNLLAGSTPLQFLISVEPSNGKPLPGKYNFRLSFKANLVERQLGEPVSLNLSVDPRQLEFVVFVFPGKSSLPAGCLYSLRVWLRVNGIDHRIFGEDELFIGKDLDFHSIADASFARLKISNPNVQVYHAFVGRALVTFTVRWRLISDGLYKYSLEYEAGGVGDTLIEDFRLRLECDPRTVSFIIYSVPIPSMPTGASHRIRLWLRSLAPFPSAADPSGAYSLPFSDSYIYQRLWKSDSFKIGAHLDFESLGNKMILGFSTGGPQTITMRPPPPTNVVYGNDKGVEF